MNQQPLLQLHGISRHFQAGEQTVTVLNNINLTIGQGEMVAIVGASGSGKSTLMNILGCLDKPSAGTYRVAGQDVATLDGDALAQLRQLPAVNCPGLRCPLPFLLHQASSCISWRYFMWSLYSSWNTRYLRS